MALCLQPSVAQRTLSNQGPTAKGQRPPGHRLVIGAGTVLLVPDSSTGLTLWATRETRPGHRPSPDFVGWFDPDSIGVFVQRARALLDDVAPEEGTGVETPPLLGRDRGAVTLLRVGDPGEPCCALTFGHPSEWQRWRIEASSTDLRSLLDSLEIIGAAARLAPTGNDVGYANPTHRRITPDRERGPLPALSGEPGEIWARLELDSTGAALPGSERILWGSSQQGEAVLKVLPGYRFRRKDGGKPARLVVYQRFRVR